MLTDDLRGPNPPEEYTPENLKKVVKSVLKTKRKKGCFPKKYKTKDVSDRLIEDNIR